MTAALSQLLSPVSLDEFISRHWDQEPLFLPRGEPDRFAGLLRPCDVEDISSSHYAHFPAVTLLDKGQMLPGEEITLSTAGVAFGAAPAYERDAPRRIDARKLFSRYRTGASIVLNCVHLGWPPIARFCHELEAALSFPVAIHAILSPPEAEAYHLHFDPVNTFVVQLSGTKRWRVYEPVTAVPVRRTLVQMPREAPERALLDVTMAPGDTLYVPRGFLHKVASCEVESLSLIIDIEPITWLDALSASLNTLHTDPRLRRTVPIGFATTGDRGRAAFEREFAAARAIAAESLGGAPAFESLRERFVAARPEVPGGHLESLRGLANIDLDAVVERRPGLFAFQRATERGVELHFGARRITLSSDAEVVARFLVDRLAFSVREVPGLKDQTKIDLVRRLVEEGVLNISPAREGASRAPA